MKPYYVLIIAAMLLALPACGQQEPSAEKTMDNVNDALDRRPDEKIRDMGEDMSEGIDDALDQRPGEKALDAGEDIGDELGDAAEEITEDVKDVFK